MAAQPVVGGGPDAPASRRKLMLKSPMSMNSLAVAPVSMAPVAPPMLEGLMPGAISGPAPTNTPRSVSSKPSPGEDSVTSTMVPTRPA